MSNYPGGIPEKFFMSAEERCAKDPRTFNITHPWECSKFSPDSLAGKCATDPTFNITIQECSKFIPPSNTT